MQGCPREGGLQCGAPGRRRTRYQRGDTRAPSTRLRRVGLLTRCRLHRKAGGRGKEADNQLKRPEATGRKEGSCDPHVRGGGAESGGGTRQPALTPG